jgi:hypothetical protein
MLELQAAGGRYPQRAFYRAAHIRATLEVRGDQVRIRIDDDGNDERWEEFAVSKNDLLRELERERMTMEHGTEQEGTP